MKTVLIEHPASLSSTAELISMAILMLWNINRYSFRNNERTRMFVFLCHFSDLAKICPFSKVKMAYVGFNEGFALLKGKR